MQPEDVTVQAQRLVDRLDDEGDVVDPPDAPDPAGQGRDGG
jgi:hypothetical protein